MTIIWDWNGTLLNDTQICVQSINLLLVERNLPTLSIDKYKEIFTFPVQKYYEKAGFDFSDEPFDIPAHQFIENYKAALPAAKLHSDTIPMLNYFKEKNYRQLVLSAMENDFLHENLKNQKVYSYFDKVAGIENHYAHSKVDVGRKLLNSINHSGDQMLLIGDTTHDFEVAKELGLECILIANGHQEKARLNGLGCTVLNNLAEITSIL